MALPLAELPVEASESLKQIYENFIDDEREICSDPFDILAALEEEQGYPLIYS